jgi:hypothetical protein
LPTFSACALSLWLSHRDTAQIVDLCINAPKSHRDDIFNATSDNSWKIFDITHAKEALGYKPEDRAGSDFSPPRSTQEATRWVGPPSRGGS